MENENKDLPLTAPEPYQSVQEPKPTTQESQSEIPQKGKKLPKAVIYILISVILLTLSVLGFWLYQKISSTFSSNLPKVTPETSQITTKLKIVKEAHSIIAYTVSEQDDVSSAVFFYDAQKKERLPPSPIIQADNNFMFLLGPWSPNGQYLPILAFTDPATEKLYVNLYLYNSQTLEAKRIYSSLRNEENFVWASTSFNFLSTWMDDSRLMLEEDRDIQKGLTTLTYITTDGELKTIQQPDKLKKVSSQLEYTTTIGPDAHIESITAGSITLDFVPEGQIVGIVDGMLAVLKKPKSISIAVDDAGNAASPQDLEYLEKEVEKLKKQGLSEEELSKKVLELIEPKGETILSLYSLKDGKASNEVNLTDGTWQTQSILVHPSGKFLIAHQTDKDFLPSKQRFITITPSEHPNTRVIFEEDLEKGGNPNYLSSLMFQGSSFFLSNDGNWIIGMRGSKVDNPQNSIVYMRNIVTGEENIVCPNYCWDMRIYYPLYLQAMY